MTDTHDLFLWGSTMKTGLTLFLCLTLTSGLFADIQPIGSLGKGRLEVISFLPDGTILRVLANRIERVDPETNAVISRFADRSEHMGEVTVSVDGSRLVIATLERNSTYTVVEIWSLTSRQKVRQWSIPRHFNPAVFSPDLSLLVGNVNGNIHFWSMETGEQLDRIEWMEHAGFV